MVCVTAGSPAAAQEPESRVVIAVLPYGTTIEEIGSVEEIAPGILSAGLGPVPVAQTYLDIAQGNRVNRKLYDFDLPRLYLRAGRVPPPLWERTLARAEGAPADVSPGLLAETLLDAGVPVAAEADSGLAALIAVDGSGAVRLLESEACAAGCGPGLTVLRARTAELADLVAGLGAEDVLIVLAGGAREEQPLLPVGVAGEGYSGNLTSDSTRTDGMVTSTDIGPTILARLGLAVPDEMNGAEIRSEGERDLAAVTELQSELSSRPSREWVALAPLVAWIVLVGLATLGGRVRAARAGLSLLAIACAWAPLVLLLAAALDASELAAGLMMGLGAPALAFVTRTAVPGLGGLALACGVTVGAHALDVVAGSPFTSRSVLGPNPGGGVRFYGIGNELEAILTTLTLIGAGCWLATRPALSRRATALWFLAIALAAAACFAPGRFGADVGAAIVLGVGAATAAVLALGITGRRAILLVAAGGALALAALFAIDLFGGGAHLSRSVLGAGEAGDLADVIERRLSLMADTFIHPVYPELLALTAALLLAAFARRRTVLGWLGEGAARCGLLGALCGVLVGTVANDSGSVLLVIGTIYLAVGTGFLWAQGATTRPSGA
jgi:hypothetical protein